MQTEISFQGNNVNGIFMRNKKIGDCQVWKKDKSSAK